MCEECKGDAELLGKCSRDGRNMLVGLRTKIIFVFQRGGNTRETLLLFFFFLSEIVLKS